MRHLASSALASAILLLGGTSVKADDWSYWGLKVITDTTKPHEVYTIVPETGEATLRTTICQSNGSGGCLATYGSTYVDETSGDFYHKENGMQNTHFRITHFLFLLPLSICYRLFLFGGLSFLVYGS